MLMMHDEVEIFCLPVGATCTADEEKRNPLDIEECPVGNKICTGECVYYME